MCTLDSCARAAKVCQLAIALAGRHFGVDLSPAANRLRAISDTGRNLRPTIDDTAARRRRRARCESGRTRPVPRRTEQSACLARVRPSAVRPLLITFTV
ncbi:DUF4394 domain-containing protein [Streptomyces zhihengii]|uniref:DUF4394 domain-containing protein n=1 Tax=Streptomyces zhihengii TaxID=1818004 RepID=A0ABS2V3A8_9ACTN|nr:DUF4394 domain-containing protein [Streptomyces zhihengii]